MQVIAVLLDNWKTTGGVDEYVAWTNNTKATHSSFFTDPQIKQWYVLCLHILLALRTT